MEVRAETKPSMLRRCRDWDYRRPCIYQITLVLADRRSQALGRLVIPGASAPGTGQLGASAPGTGQLATGEPAAAAGSYISLTEAGEAVKREFWDMGRHHPEIRPLELAVMPDHCHFIIRVTRRMDKPLGNAIGGFKSGSSKAAIGQPGLWSEGFQDTILFHDGQLEAMFNYLRDNPRRLAVKRLCPDLFRVTRDLRLPFRAYGGRGSVPEAAASGHFTAIGNHFLLDAPDVLQVQVSRRDFAYKRQPKPGGGLKIERDERGRPVTAMATPDFIEKRDMLLGAASKGAVLLSPCISDGEREIARLAFEEGHKVVTLSNKGFSPLYKPGGRLFEMTANGNLLMLAPINWPYVPCDKPITRIDACILNRIAQWLAGPGATEIAYRGVTPLEIDRLAGAVVAAQLRGAQAGANVV